MLTTALKAGGGGVITVTKTTGPCNIYTQISLTWNVGNIPKLSGVRTSRVYARMLLTQQTSHRPMQRVRIPVS